MKFRLDLFFKLLALCWLLGSNQSAQAQTKPDPNAAPNDFVQQVADQVLTALKADSSVRAGNTARVNQIVDDLILPNVNFEKTTRLAAGRYWRQATPEQQAALVKAFRGTLGRAYSGAFTRVDEATSVKVLPLRGEADASAATDIVVKSQVTQRANTQPIGLDYRLEKTPQGWKIYDLNVENIWLIENYRGQFAQQISQTGIDGLIQALNQRAQQ
jgi:phospholipid transport system substrate-binding protein